LGALSNGDFASMVDAQLYLPQDWCSDTARCDEAGIPQKYRTFKTKTELALEMVQHQAALGTVFNYVGADGFYGNSIDFAEGIDALGYLYMLDIHSNQTIYLEEPGLEIPQKKGRKGRAPTQIQPTVQGMSVRRYMNSLSDDEWKNLTVRNTAKGKLTGDYHFKRVFIWDKEHNLILRRLLVIRRTFTPSGEAEYKYSFTNANLEQYTQEGWLAYMQTQRFFVEHCIKESKQIPGMDQFQTRKWMAWQHQIGLNFPVCSFMLKEKIRCFEWAPLLSARDIKDLLVFKLYKQMTNEQFLEMLFNRHLRRQQDINNAFKRQEFNLLK